MSIPRVLGKNLLCLEIEKPVEPGKLILEGIASEYKQYKVVAIGSDVKNIEVDSTVSAVYYAGTPFNHSGNKYVIISLDNILAII